MIDKNTEISVQELNLFPIKGKNIELNFNGDRISSDGGLLLLRELDSQLNLLSSASNCIHDDRDQRYIDHSVKELLTQRVFQIAAGYEDCNDCNDLREDMIFKLCAGRLPQNGSDLTSQPTMSRLDSSGVFSQATFNGLDMNLGNLSILSNAKTRSIRPENFTGEKGKAGMAGIVDKEQPNAANASNVACDLGWLSGGRYLPQQSDIASTCFWYQSDPYNKFSKLPTLQQLEVN